jgi:hypothetical protein
VVVSEAELLLVSGSVPPEPADTVAVFVIEPIAGMVEGDTIVRVIVWVVLAFNVGIETVTVVPD